MKAAKKYKIKKMNSCFAKKPKTYGYPTARIDWVFKKYNKKIKWKVVDVYTAGKTGYVDVKVTRPNFYGQEYDAFYQTLWWGWKKWHYKAENHGSEMGLRALKKFNSKVKHSKKKTYTEIVNFPMIKTSKGWKIKKKSRKIVDIATGYFWEAQDDAVDDFADDLAASMQ